MSKFDSVIDFIKGIYPDQDFIPLHSPMFRGNEKKYLLDTIDSTFVSSVGQYVDKFELMMAQNIGVAKAVAVVNGTAGLHAGLRMLGVKFGDEVITQALTFIATANAISYIGASPVFLDVDLDTMGLSANSLSNFLEKNGEIREGGCFNKLTNKRIAACMPMHTFGFPVKIHEILDVCNKWEIPVIEDAAESIGSLYKGKATGSFGKLSVFSFNGNKIITSGGGGAILTNDLELGMSAKHLTTTAKIAHRYEYAHDAIGYNFRMPNINAALACAQIEQLEGFLLNKRELASEYFNFFSSKGIKFRTENSDTKANYWLMSIEMESKAERDSFLNQSNNENVMTRPIWQLMFRMPMYQNCYKDEQKNAIYLEERIVNIPSSVR